MQLFPRVTATINVWFPGQLVDQAFQDGESRGDTGTLPPLFHLMPGSHDQNHESGESTLNGSH